MHRRALAALEASVGTTHPDYAVALASRGGLFEAIGSIDDAEPLYRRALEATRSALGKGHPRYAAALNNLAGLIADRDPEAAEPLYREAADIVRTAFGSAHPEYATLLHNLAWLRDAADARPEAERLYRDALATTSSAHGDENPGTATLLRGLGSLLAREDRVDEAEPLLAKAVTLARRLGPGHPELAMALQSHATLRAATGDWQPALRFLRESIEITNGMVRQVIALGSDRQRLAYMATIRRELELTVSLALALTEGDDAPRDGVSAEGIRLAGDLVLRRKGVTAEVLALHRDAVLLERHPEFREELQRLAALRAQIARRTLDGPGPEGPDAHTALLAEWAAAREELERTIAADVPSLGFERRLQRADVDGAAAALPEGSALIEFLRGPTLRLTEDASDRLTWRPARYVAFVVRAGSTGTTKLLDLGDAETTDRLIATLRQAIPGAGSELRDVEPEGEHDGRANSEQAATNLAARILHPWLGSLDESCRRLFLAVDGELTTLPFEILPLDEQPHTYRSHTVIAA
jgi:tetratricopeptide (TPR) repeat protein